MASKPEQRPPGLEKPSGLSQQNRILLAQQTGQLRTHVAIGVLILLTQILVFISASRIGTNLRITCDWVSHTHVVSEALRDAQYHLSVAEAGERGYLLTHDASYLGEYNLGRSQFPLDLTKLQGLTADTIDQQQRVALLRPLCMARLAELANVIAVRHAGDEEQAVALVLKNHRFLLTERIQSLLFAMETEENRLLRQRLAASNGMITVSGWAIRGSVSLATLLLVLSCAVTLRYSQNRRHTDKLLQDDAIVREFQNSELETANTALEELATTDGLTGLKNARSFQMRLRKEFAESLRSGSPLSLIIVDVDHFKNYNDTFGHLEGDTVLSEVGRILQSNARTNDMAARYGGEELVVLLPHTDHCVAAGIAERIRAAFHTTSWDTQAVTASFGVATMSSDCRQANDLVGYADKALYRAKASGRDCVCLHGAD